jgi:hypothetical protein
MIPTDANEYLFNKVAQCLEMKMGQPHLPRQAVLIGLLAIDRRYLLPAGVVRRQNQ